MRVKKAMEDFKRIDSQITKLNHNCEVCARKDLDLFHKSSGIISVAGTLLVVTIAYSLGWLKNTLFCSIVWLLQFYSLGEIEGTDFYAQNSNSEKTGTDFFAENLFRGNYEFGEKNRCRKTNSQKINSAK